tara:strand:+ start:2226 stop:3932 length:1707 start_codon:yes stop_codon:yes gene_type:complete
MIKSISGFIKTSLKELNPWHNIKLLHTNVRGDILAGIAVAIIALPMALAFGVQSGLGPIAGVLGAIAGGIIGGLFGGCLVGVSGPTTPKAAQIATFYAVLLGTSSDPVNAAFSIIFLSGLILIGISFLKISRFVHYIPYPVVAGFMCGIGLTVIILQINPFVGFVELEGPKKHVYEVLASLGDTFKGLDWQVLCVSIPCLLVLFLWSYGEKKLTFLKYIPSPLFVLIIGTSISLFLELKPVYTIGSLMEPFSSPEEETAWSWKIQIPNLSEFTQYIGPAFALAGLAVLDSLLSCKIADNMTNKRHSSDRETFGQGMANIAAGLMGGVTTATATMRTVANIKFGAKTPLASIVHGLVLLSILLWFHEYVKHIPIACLAAILVKVGVDILDYRIIPVLRKLSITDLLIFAIVLFVTVFWELMIAVGIGIAFAVLRYIKEVRLTLKSKYIHKIIPVTKSDFFKKEHKNLSISVLCLNGPLFFGSVESLTKIYSTVPKQEILIIDMSNVSMVDLSGAFGLEDFIKNRMENNIRVFVFGAGLDIKENLEKMNFIKNIGKENYSDSKDYIINLI